MSPLLGAHMSVAGGLPHAVDRAIAHRCEAFQIFSRNANRWKGRPLPPAEIAAFRAKLRAAGLGPVFSHASYLINLATATPDLRQMSLEAMADEIDRADALALGGVVLHPGCYTSGNAEEGLELVAAALLDLLRTRERGRTMILLENTAGQGTALGATLEQLASIIAGVNGHRRVGVCLDTCHLLASGYDIASLEGYAATFAQFTRHVGLDRLKLVHLNDSKKPLGSRVDRHEHIGKGFVGLETFRRIVNDTRFRRLPMLLETPKEEGRRQKGLVQIDRLDQKNLRTLRRLRNI
jgi:deoxyribonuclease-4